MRCVCHQRGRVTTGPIVGPLQGGGGDSCRVVESASQSCVHAVLCACEPRQDKVALHKNLNFNMVQNRKEQEQQQHHHHHHHHQSNELRRTGRRACARVRGRHVLDPEEDHMSNKIT